MKVLLLLMILLGSCSQVRTIPEPVEEDMEVWLAGGGIWVIGEDTCYRQEVCDGNK